MQIQRAYVLPYPQFLYNIEFFKLRWRKYYRILSKSLLGILSIKTTSSIDIVETSTLLIDKISSPGRITSPYLKVIFFITWLFMSSYSKLERHFYFSTISKNIDAQKLEIF